MKHFIIQNKEKIIVIAFWLIVWQIAAVVINQPLYLPSVFESIQSIFVIMAKKGFWINVIATFSRVIAGLGLSALLGIILGILSAKSSFVEALLSPFLSTVKAIPTMSIIILALVWLRSGSVPVFVVFMLCFPIMYTNTFNGQNIYESFSHVFREKSITVITGASGRGKTTLLRMITGLDKDYTGTIENLPTGLSFLFQENALLPWKNVYDNIEFVIKGRLPANEAKRRIDTVLRYAFLENHQHKFPSELSGGMQRRVALCRSFVYPAQLILLDEPFTGLDNEMKEKVADSFFSMIRGKVTTIIVSHDVVIIDKCDD